MSIPKRHRKLPGTYFVTSRTWECRPLFAKPPACEIFVDTLLHYRQEGVYVLHAFILMPEHFHVLLTPATIVTLERVVQHIKGGSSHRIRRELAYQFTIWQRGFSDHRVRDAEDYAVHLRYIERNPVKRHLVTDARDYAWSSASGRFTLDEPPQGLKPQTREARFGTAEAVP